LSSSVRKIWESAVVDPVCISDADMPLSLVTRRETISRGSSAAESGVCTGDSVARAASTEASRTPSLDEENGCHSVGENSSVQEQIVSAVAADQPSVWPTARVTTDSLPAVDDGRSSANEDIRSSSTATSRSSGIALPPRKRLTRNAEELQSSATDQPAALLGVANSPSSAPNFRSCWKKFAAKSNISGPSSHRAFVGKPQYDCRTYFQKLAEQARAAAASKAFVPGKGKGHCYRNANKTSPRSSDQNTGSPRVTRSQSKPKKSQSPKSSPSEPPAPVRKSTRKKSINTRFDEYDRTVGKNKKAKSLSDSNAAASGADEASQTSGDVEVTPGTENSSQRKKNRRGKLVKGESAMDADMSSSVCADGEDSTSQSQFTSEAAQPVSETDSKQSNTTSYVPTVADEGSDLNAKTEDTVEPQSSAVITVLPPKFRHFKIKTAAAALNTSQPPSNAERPIVSVSESGISEVAVSVKADDTDVAVSVMQSEIVANEEKCKSKHSSVENSIPTESLWSTLAMEEQPKVSQSHSVGGRKSLLYRSSAIVTSDSQPSTELKQVPVFSQTELSVTTEAVNDSSVDLKSANDDISASEHNRVSSEQNDTLDSATAEALSSESREKAHSNVCDVHVEQPVEVESSRSSDTRSPSPSIADMDFKTCTILSDTSNTTSNNVGTLTAKESVEPSEHDSGATNVDNAAQQFAGSRELPADTSNKSDSQNRLHSTEGSDVLVKSSSQSLESQPSHVMSAGIASELAESELCTTPVTTVAQTASVTCRMTPVDVTGGMAEESVSQNDDSRKRLLPNETINDDTKRRRIDSFVEDGTDRLSTDAASEPSDTTPETSTACNLVSLSGDIDSVSNAVTLGQLQTELSSSTQSNSKPDRTSTLKTNHKLKPNRSHRTLKTTDTEPSVLERSNNLTAETLTAESKASRVGEKYEPPLLDNVVNSNNVTPAPNMTAVVKYAVANSVDRVCDINSDVSSVHSEQKTLRISIVALNESVLSSAAAHRVKDSRTESNSDKLSSSSPAVPVSMTTASSVVVNNIKQLTSGSSVADGEPPVASTGSILSQDSLALEHDSSALLSQCKSLSVVIRKMHDDNSSTPAPPPAAVPKPAGRQRKHGHARHRVSHGTKPEVHADKPLLTAEKNAVELSPVESDEYRFTDDSVADSLPPQRMSRLERKVSSRKVRNALPASEQIELSLAATSDSNSRDAASTVDSSLVASGSAEVTPDAVQKVSSKLETRSGRSRRRKQHLQEDEDTRSLSPFSQNGNSPVPVVEASLDGHKLKLRIINRSTEGSTSEDAKLAALSSSSVELTVNKTDLQVDQVQIPDEESPPTAIEVPPPSEPLSRRRRQLKVEGVRSRFLTLHKPSVASIADHVKCRLVKVGRRQWMSVGGEEADEVDSDAETPARSISPVSCSINEMPQHPTRDRLLLVSDNRKPQRRRGRPPKAKTNLEDTNASVASVKQTKKKVKTDESHLEVSFSKPELPPEVVSRPTRVAPVPWLDCETESSETQPYSALVDSSSRTIATDIEEYRSCVSTPVEFMSNTDLMISDALTDSSVELAYSSVRTPKSMFFVQSELERLMEDMVLDDRHRQPRIHTPPLSVACETHIPVQRSADVARTFSHSNGIFSPLFSPQNDREVDLLLSQPSVRLRNCMLPVDVNDSSDYDCAVVGYDHPTYCCHDFVDLPSLPDQLVDADYSLPPVCLTDPQFYGSVDFVL